MSTREQHEGWYLCVVALRTDALAYLDDLDGNDARELWRTMERSRRAGLEALAYAGVRTLVVDVDGHTLPIFEELANGNVRWRLMHDSAWRDEVRQRIIADLDTAIAYHDRERQACSTN